MGVSNDMDKLTRLIPTHLRKHHSQQAVLVYIERIRSQYVLRALIKYGIKLVSCYIERHAVCARFKVHFRKVCKIVNICKYTAALRIILELPYYIIDLIHLALREFILLRQLVPVGLSYRMIFAFPLVPYMSVKLTHVI